MKGTLLVELERPELTMQINEIAHQFEELKIQRQLKIENAKTRISQLDAQKALAVSEVDYEIKQIKARHNFNKKLTAELKSVDKRGEKFRRFSYQFHAGFGIFDVITDDFLDIFRSFGGFLRQGSYFGGYYGESSTGFAGPGRFYRCV